MNNEIIIGVAGRAQHGKDTIASVLVREYGFVQVGFADALRALAMRLNPIIEAADFEAMIPSMTYQDLFFDLGYEGAKEVPAFRDFLKDLGEGVRNVLGPDSWVNALKHTLDLNREVGLGRFVIPDVRYDNEVKAVRREGGTIVKVDRPGFDSGVDPTHPSESNVPFIVPDYLLRNSGTVEDLKVLVRDLIAPVLA